MWVFLNDAMLSIVAPKPGLQADPATLLVVRARFEGDIERVFPGAKVVEGVGTDYRFRALIRRHTVAAALKDEVERIAYTNFKDSVADDDRHQVYSDVWGVLRVAQDDARLARVPRARPAPAAPESPPAA